MLLYSTSLVLLIAVLATCGKATDPAAAAGYNVPMSQAELERIELMQQVEIYDKMLDESEEGSLNPWAAEEMYHDELKEHFEQSENDLGMMEHDIDNEQPQEENAWPVFTHEGQEEHIPNTAEEEPAQFIYKDEEEEYPEDTQERFVESESHSPIYVGYEDESLNSGIAEDVEISTSESVEEELENTQDLEEPEIILESSVGNNPEAVAEQKYYIVEPEEFQHKEESPEILKVAEQNAREYK